MERDKHQQLIDLTWRYAILIGITDNAGIEGMITDEMVELDLKRWGHLVKRNMGGRPVFIDDDAIDFTAAESGQSIEDCERVLAEEWALSQDMIAD